MAYLVTSLDVLWTLSTKHVFAFRFCFSKFNNLYLNKQTFCKQTTLEHSS